MSRTCISTPDAPPPIGPYCQGNLAAMNGVYAKRFQQPYPVRSIIQTALPERGALVAMDAIALRPEEKP
ncbi:MAG TPA: hypothetical protein VF215_06430 [Thermoanaerobaculia bacterium]